MTVGRMFPQPDHHTGNMTAMSWCTNNTSHACVVDVLQGVAYSVLFLLGFLFNAAALVAFITKRNSWTDTHVYIFNLVIADSALILFLPFRIYDSFFCLEKSFLCTFLIFVHFINMYASMLTTTAISVQRYLAVRFPLQARLWKRKKEVAFVVCLIIWGSVVTICILFREANYPDKLWMCFERCKDKPLKVEFLIVIVSLGFLTPLLIVVFCSSQIICILKGDEKLKETKRIIAANMFVFIVCYTPIHVAFIVNNLNKQPDRDWRRLPEHMYLLVSEWIATTNCCFDSISYYLLLKRFYS